MSSAVAKTPSRHQMNDTTSGSNVFTMGGSSAGVFPCRNMSWPGAQGGFYGLRPAETLLLGWVRFPAAPQQNTQGNSRSGQIFALACFLCGHALRRGRPRPAGGGVVKLSGRDLRKNGRARVPEARVRRSASPPARRPQDLDQSGLRCQTPRLRPAAGGAPRGL